jgi:hypothetical protein
VRFFVLVNDTPTVFFSSSSSLRQANPLFPFLFIIIMETLSTMISLMNGGILSKFMMGPKSGGAINISHLLFADDTLIFGGANLDHLHNLRVCFYALKWFQL